VAMMFAFSHWGALEAGKKTTGSLAALLLGAAVVGAGAGFFIVKSFFKPDDWPKIHTFGPLVALGSFLSILYIRREGMRRGFEPEVLTGLAVEVLLVGVAGSRILFILITPESFEHDPKNGILYNYVIQYLALWNGGLVWYGGLLPAAVFALWRGAKLGLPWRTIADIFAPAVMLGLGVGRIGCLMAGDDHGKLVTSGDHWWTLTFPVNDPKTGEPGTLCAKDLQGKPIWPSQPLMSIGDFIIFALCHSLQRRLQDRPPAVMLIMMTLYPILRFFIEFIRGDIVRKFLIAYAYKSVWDPKTMSWVQVPSEGLSTSQAISIPLAVFSLVCLIYVVLKPPRGIEQPGPLAALKTPESAPAPAPPPPSEPAPPAAPPAPTGAGAPPS